MSNSRRITGFARMQATIVAVSVLLAGCGGIVGEERPIAGDRLAACAGDHPLFKGMTVEEAAQTYHATVSAVLTAQSSSEGGVGSSLRCNVDLSQNIVPPSDKLQELSSAMNGGEDDDTLSAGNMPALLLEYLRIYECKLLHERQSRALTADGGAEENETVFRGPYLEETKSIQEFVERELTIARPTLNRALLLYAGAAGMQPTAAEMECIKRASLDVRNSLGLLAEALSCSPRAMDAKGSLRDPPTQASSNAASEHSSSSSEASSSSLQSTITPIVFSQSSTSSVRSLETIIVPRSPSSASRPPLFPSSLDGTRLPGQPSPTAPVVDDPANRIFP